LKQHLVSSIAGVGLVLAATAARAEVQAATFSSQALGREVSVALQLPPSYESSPKRRYPVVYALHGLFEGAGFWERRGLAAALDRLWATGKLPEFVLVAVDGGNSFYVNGPGGLYEDVVTREAPPWVEAHYRVIPGREARALWGVSMGGYAGLRIAFAHPEVFQAVATHSAMLLQKIPSREDGAGRWHMEAFGKIFGDPIDPAAWAAADPLALSARADPRTAPALRFDCGGQDRFGLYQGNQALHQRLEARGVRHEFEILPGDHGYEYVLSVFEKGLRFLTDSGGYGAMHPPAPFGLPPAAPRQDKPGASLPVGRGGVRPRLL